jgi:hypothetical protein
MQKEHACDCIDPLAEMNEMVEHRWFEAYRSRAKY